MNFSAKQKVSRQVTLFKQPVNESNGKSKQPSVGSVDAEKSSNMFASDKSIKETKPTRVTKKAETAKPLEKSMFEPKAKPDKAPINPKALKPLPKLKNVGKKWTNNMPPMLGHQARNQDVTEHPEYDQDKYCIYAVFRQKILDKVIRDEIIPIASKAITEAKEKRQEQRQRRLIKSQEDVKRGEHNLDGNAAYEVPLIESRYLDFNFQKEIMKKKHMLDLMMQRKMNKRK